MAGVGPFYRLVFYDRQTCRETGRQTAADPVADQSRCVSESWGGRVDFYPTWQVKTPCTLSCGGSIDGEIADRLDFITLGSHVTVCFFPSLLMPLHPRVSAVVHIQTVWSRTAHPSSATTPLWPWLRACLQLLAESPGCDLFQWGNFWHNTVIQIRKFIK